MVIGNLISPLANHGNYLGLNQQEKQKILCLLQLVFCDEGQLPLINCNT
ncbi:hypothetical protein NIES23_19740 [Trichormus variabilis NIES-23]|uniref:Uncharacterized protein n=1 Tax=Trichormus variabilis NIES-23 TaxID=1973479 RepID=A0A1Z4KJL5_ANAVA|nr:hypothetical protein NIES23_19740 [Trichormus variabilis NIES-23]